MPKDDASNPSRRSRKGAPSKAKTGKSLAPKSAAATTPSAANADPLGELRVRISRIDQQLVELLNRRARLVVQVGHVKREHGIPIYTPHREAEVLARVLSHNTGPLADRTIEGVFREVMSGSFRLEQPLRIGYLGPVGSYSHVAAVKHFGTSVDFEDLHTIGGVFNEVARAHVDYGLVPIENSIGGGIVETLDAFQEFQDKLNIYAEVQLEVHHALLANCAPGEVTRIYSKPEVFVQCREWLATQYPDAELVPETSSSAAVRRVAGESGGAANPAKGTKKSARAAGNSGGVTNITRFFIISKQKAKPTGTAPDSKPGDKTSIMFTTSDKPGALVSVLSVFDRAGINLTHIDKRPSGRSNWTYTFFIDAEGHIDEQRLVDAVAEARGHCREMLVLGSYPRSRRIL